MTETPERIPVLPLRDLVYFPAMVLPLLVGRPRSVAALEEAVAGSKKYVSRFDSSCFSGEYVTQVEPDYFERIRQQRSDAAKNDRRKAS